jgi:acyl dehydratase
MNKFGAEAPFRVGEVFSKEITLTPHAIRHFAQFVGDPNPMHSDEAKAAASRFGVLIASGIHSSSILSSFMASIVTERVIKSLGLEICFQFRKAVRADRPMRAQIRIDAVEPRSRPATYLLKMDASLIDQEETFILVSGHGTSLLMCDL